MYKSTIRLFTPLALVVSSVMLLGAQVPMKKLPEGPERFSVNAQTTASGGGTGAMAATFVVALDRYNSDKERDALAAALKHGGYPGFLPALRAAPIVGRVEAGDKRANIRYAFQRQAGPGRSIVVVTEEPVYFIGGGSANAKPREGYGVAVLQFDVDDVGLGSGTMAAAARVKPGGPAGIQIDDYAEKPIKLTTVRKLIS